MTMKKIGILSKNYAAKRLFLNKIGECQYKDIRFYNWYLWKNAHLWLLRAIGKLNMTPEEAAAKLFYDYKAIAPTGCDVFHFFNTINHSNTPHWVISVESCVPWPLEVTRIVESDNPDFSLIKDNSYVLEAMKRLASNNCLALLPLSHCSKNIQKCLITQFPQYEKRISEKLIALLPPQELKIKSLDEKGLSYGEAETFTFVYVGRNYFRKGGRDTVEVLAKLHKKYQFKLILISALDKDEAKYERTDHDLEDAQALIEANKEWIEYYPSLPNNQVLDKIKKAHVALLPTWMDTFAYSVLECQACGTPVISTSLRALTELNDASVGWLIDVPVNKLNNPIMNTPEDFIRFESQLQKGLERAICHVLDNRLEVREKAANCLLRIQKRHNPQRYNECLRLAYEGKVGEIEKILNEI